MSRTESIHGLHAVYAALRNDPRHVREVWIDQARRDRRLQEVLDAAQAHGVPVRPTDAANLERKAGTRRHQGVLAVYTTPPVISEDQWLASIAGQTDPALILVLDNITDPHNLGACLRTAEAAGVQAVVVPRHRAVGITPTVAKVASGAVGRVPLITATNLVRLLHMLRTHGVWLIGLDSAASQSLYAVDLKRPLALVLGSEGRGMRRLTRETCDGLARLPMRGMIGSLNVSVAAGIALYEILRQRDWR